MSEIEEKLEKASKTFDPKQYNPMSLFEIMQTANTLKTFAENMFHFLHSYQLVYLSCNIFLIFVYSPLVFVSWRDLRSKSKFLAMKFQISGDTHSQNLIELQEVMQDTRTTLIYRSIPTFLDLLVSLPGLGWILEKERNVHFFQVGKHLAIIKLVFFLPVSVALN
ncbi:hypothetical protein O181_034416, partial [Austropuccinia psidii MF-1]|nr:hypothetical protein [Austropuccinia psidii MF-1]